MKNIKLFQWSLEFVLLNLLQNLSSNNEASIQSDTTLQDIVKSEKKYFNDYQNQNFSVLWLKWIQKMETKQNQGFFHGAYSNLTSYIFLSKKAKLFQWLSKSKFLSVMTKVDLNNRNETKSVNFPCDIFKSDNIFQWSQNTKLFRWLL